MLLLSRGPAPCRCYYYSVLVFSLENDKIRFVLLSGRVRAMMWK